MGPWAEMRGSLMEPLSLFDEPAILDVAGSPGKAYNPWSDHTTVFCPRRHEGRLLDQCFGEGSLKAQQSQGNTLLSFSFRRPQGKLLKEACINDGRAQGWVLESLRTPPAKDCLRGAFLAVEKATKENKEKETSLLLKLLLFLAFYSVQSWLHLTDITGNLNQVSYP